MYSRWFLLHNELEFIHSITKEYDFITFVNYVEYRCFF